MNQEYELNRSSGRLAISSLLDAKEEQIFSIKHALPILLA
jgi:hypothetical protein